MSLRNAGGVLLVCLAALFVPPRLTASNAPRARWTEQQARDYMSHQPWPVGSNFLPKDSINQLEMFQQATYDPTEIDKEFGWAEAAGMTTMRIFLHDLLWQQDAQGFGDRVDNLLGVAAKHHIKPVLVLFDSCWDPNPVLGPQHPPIPGVHNSGWVQSPGVALRDSAQIPRLKTYVTGVIGRFANDDRILAWDLWNEPDNSGGGHYENLPNKVQLVDDMLPQVFDWARSVGPVQPLTSGVWKQGSWDDPNGWSPTERIQLTESDIISFHNYGWPEQFEARIVSLEKLNRPIICTEYMARGSGSTIDTILPIAARHHVGAINWGLVQGRMQTYLPWDSWQIPYVSRQPTVWFHDLFYPDGTPYRSREIEIIHDLSAQLNRK